MSDPHNATVKPLASIDVDLAEKLSRQSVSTVCSTADQSGKNFSRFLGIVVLTTKAAPIYLGHTRHNASHGNESMTAAQKLTAEYNAVQEIASQVKKECGNGMKGQSALIAKWNKTGRYMSFGEAATMEARNRFYGWGK